MPSNANSGILKGAIIEALRQHPEGLTFRDISEVVGHHRHTITKYVYELIGAQVILERDIGAAKLCYLRKSYNGFGNANGVARAVAAKGQAQLAVLVMLLLLVPATIIMAQSAGNYTIPSSTLEGMTVASDPPAANETSTHLPEAAQQEGIPVVPYENGDGNGSVEDPPADDPSAGTGNATAPLDETAGTGDGENQTAQQNVTDDTTGNLTAIEENITNATDTNTTGANLTGATLNETAHNVTINVTETNVTVANDTITNETAANVTVPGMNETFPGNVTVNVSQPQLPAAPDVQISIINPERVSRGDAFSMTAVIENHGGDAKDARLEWVLPEHILLAEGSIEETIGDIPANSTRVSGISVYSTNGAALGVSEIRVRLSYG